MFQALLGRKTVHRHGQFLYGAVVARARNPVFYTSFGVPDTFDGRFEMLVIHNYLVARRLKRGDRFARDVSQSVFDLFLNDMDSALREAAVGDVTVPKRIAKMTRVFYGRTGAFDAAFDVENVRPELSAVISRNLFPEHENAHASDLLAGYMMDNEASLESREINHILEASDVFVPLSAALENPEGQ